MTPQFLMFAAALAQGGAQAPVSDDDAAVMFMQSRLVPATFEMCAEFYPANAADYTSALAAWNRTNKPTIDRGGAHARKRLQQEGQDLDEVLTVERDKLKVEIRQMPDTDRAGLCARMLATTRAES